MADVTLPQLGETVTEGTITQWFKQVGDDVAADEPLFEVSTDKVDTEVPAPAAGKLTEIRAEEGETVDVGTVIAVIGDASDATGEAGGDGASDGDAASEEPAAEEPAAEEPAAEEPAAEEPAAEEPAPEDPASDEHATEKAATEEPAAEESADEEPAAEEPAPEDPASDEPATEKAATEEPADDEPASSGESEADDEPATKSDAAPKNDTRLLSPVVRRLVNENNLDPSSITGSGPGGRITRDDVLDHLDKVASGGGSAAPKAAEQPAAKEPDEAEPAAPAAPPEPAASAEPAEPSGKPAAAAPAAAAAPTVSAGDRDSSQPLSKIRKLTGAHMVMSRSVAPHAFSVVEVDFANVDRARGAAKSAWKERYGFSLTYLPFICRAVVDALDEFPHLNASVGTNELVVHNFVDLGIAVDLDYEGLLVPVIRDAETKRLGAIAKEINDLANRARNRKLGPDEISGGTFTISNNGSAGSVLTAPIIGQPQVAILSTDAIVAKPVAAPLSDGSYAVVVHPVGNLAMSWDHRAFDGAYAAGFLKRIKELLETKDWNSEL
ncbi:MAG: 2-oxo acid dehydrogenase subunit E2 [Acidimicrobiia bacterium]|nr:2-oxo acid dehydrogenase subunit E2 [Acidimicrobiia bacterium]